MIKKLPGSKLSRLIPRLLSGLSELVFTEIKSNGNSSEHHVFPHIGAKIVLAMATNKERDVIKTIKLQ
jgi:hypothetical protein